MIFMVVTNTASQKQNNRPVHGKMIMATESVNIRKTVLPKANICLDVQLWLLCEMTSGENCFFYYLIYWGKLFLRNVLAHQCP